MNLLEGAGDFAKSLLVTVRCFKYPTECQKCYRRPHDCEENSYINDGVFLIICYVWREFLSVLVD